jgi:Second Messenger Oligonucleotide or Dinucleotide Synthetase domain
MGGITVMAWTVEAAFNEFLDRQRLTSNQVTMANARIGALQDFFNNSFTMAERAFTTGSYARGTICSGQRDIDLMAPLSYTAYKDRYDNDSRAFLYYVRDKLNGHYHSTSVSSRQVAVTLDFQSIAADVVPCFQRSGTGGGYFIPNGRGGWQDTNPKYHTHMIAEGDKVHNGRLKPLIRLIKAWNLANGNHLRSFHVELSVYNLWKGYTIGATLPQTVSSTLNVLASWVNNRCSDPWNPIAYVDDYLSTSERALVVRLLKDDAISAARAEEYRKVGNIQEAFERWKVIYRTAFPAYG